MAGVRRITPPLLTASSRTDGIDQPGGFFDTRKANRMTSQTPRHPVDVTKLNNRIIAQCTACPAYFESQGHDETSRQATATWINEHEARA